MGQDEIEAGIAEGIGKSAAVVCVHTALIRLLFRKKLISAEDVATLAGEAETALTSMDGLSAESLVMAQAALRGFASSWTKVVTKN
jgi:hypothetical protein